MPPVDGKPKTLKLSPSRLNTFRECPRCFWNDIHGLGPPSGPMSSLPQAMDLIVKDYYDKHRAAGLPPLLKGKLPVKLVDPKTAAMVRAYINWTDPETGAVLRGKMDDCFVDGKGQLVIMDNKTRGFDVKEILDIYLFQLDTYAFLLEKAGHKVAATGYLVYFIPERGTDISKGVYFRAEPHKVKINPGRVLSVFRKAVDVAKQARPPAHHKECEMCIWVKGMVVL